MAEGGCDPRQPKSPCKENFVTACVKRGRMLVASYEAIRFQRLDLFTVTLKQIGAYIGPFPDEGRGERFGKRRRKPWPGR